MTGVLGLEPKIHTKSGTKVWLRQRRMERYLSQADLAEALGISPSRMSEYENGHRLPELERALDIAHYLGTTVESVWQRKEHF